MAITGGAGYEITRATGACAATGRVIQPGEEYMAALIEVGDERLERRDYSLEAWQSSARPPRLFGYWRCQMEQPGAKRQALIDDAALMDLFEQLEGTTEPARVSFRYLLALLLMRKKLLKYEGTVRTSSGPAVMRLRQATPAGAPPAPLLEVTDPGMNDAAVAEAIEQITAVMAGGAA